MKTNNHYYRLLIPVMLWAMAVYFLWTEVGAYTSGLFSEKTMEFSMILYGGIYVFVGSPLLVNVIQRFQKMRGALNKVKRGSEDPKHKEDFFSFLSNGLPKQVYLIFEVLSGLITLNLLCWPYSNKLEGFVFVTGGSAVLALFFLLFVEIEDVFGGCWCFDTTAMPKDWRDEIKEFQKENKIMTRQRILNSILERINTVVDKLLFCKKKETSEPTC